jgi:hypothetical protein
MQFDDPIRIGVRDGEHFPADSDLGVELFDYFTCECNGVRLPRLDLASWKFPIAGKMNSIRPAGDEKRIFVFDDSGGNDDAPR